MLVVMDHINHPDHFLLDFVLELNCMSSGETRGETVTPTPSHAHLEIQHYYNTAPSYDDLMNYFDIQQIKSSVG